MKESKLLHFIRSQEQKSKMKIGAHMWESRTVTGIGDIEKSGQWYSLSNTLYFMAQDWNPSVCKG